MSDKNYHKKYYQKNKERLKARRMERYEKYEKNSPEYIEKRKAYLREYHRLYARMESEKRRERRFKRRQQVLEKLGGKCVYCGYDSDWRALQIDHIKGGGYEERERITQHGLHKKIIDGNIKELKQEYQILCANCNWIKRYKNKENAKGRSIIN